MARRSKVADSTWKFEQINEGVHTLDLNFNVKNSKEIETLWLADVHWDNPKCERDVFKKVLDEALVKNCPVFIIGDFFCAMQGSYDPRKSKSDIRPEHSHGNYFDCLVDTAAEWLKPYSQIIVMITEGNHETKILKNHETDLLDRLCYKLRSEGGVTMPGTYQGWVQINYTQNGKRMVFDHIFYHHGFGGGGPVTKGMIDFNRLAEQVVADVYISGHIHRSNLNDQVVMELDERSLKVNLRDREYVRLSTFKQEGDKPHGWAVERAMGPRPISGKWCEHSIRYKKGEHAKAHRVWYKAD